MGVVEQGRFVVLFHRAGPRSQRGDHWDLMLEQSQGLWTWALEAPPTNRPVSALRLADHRKAYLEYEGPLSGNRGEVSRWDWGHYRLLHHTDRELVIVFQGRKLQGSWRLSRQSPPDHWRLEPWGQSGEAD